MPTPEPQRDTVPPATSPHTLATRPDDAQAKDTPQDTAADQVPPQKVSKRNVAGILLTTFANSAATLMPALVGLPIIVARVAPENKESGLGIALGITAFLGMLLAPVFGAISDRTTLRIGMRRPFLIVGPAVTILGLVLLGLANSLGAVYAAVTIMALGQGIAGAADGAMIPDSIPDRFRGRVYGFSTVTGVSAGLIASVVGPQFIGNQFLLTTLAIPLYVPLMAIGLWLYRDRVLDPKDVPQQPILRTLLAGYHFNPRSAPDFAWVWLGRFFVTFAVAFTGAFAIYFLTDQLKVSQAELPALIAINSALSLGGTTLGTIVGAFVTDRVRSRRNLVMVAALMLAAGGLIVAFSPTVPIFLIGSGLLFFAIGLFIPTDGVLVMSVLPGGGKSDVAKYMSLIVIADQLPRSIGPMIAPGIIALGALTSLGGYPALYLTAGAVAIVGGLLVRRVRTVN
ncbi:MFS transporter [Nonomuraea basaltis]|uniref:MFS transporter n=1 Tax=Nonomuraea basaltis TaxID=2495887 RepID=UPI00110C4FC0|nr:MFS transporter [Nonomuraea basaltis]TMR91076.1 MFS transporter [Nonomuraea basaltis]